MRLCAWVRLCVRVLARELTYACVSVFVWRVLEGASVCVCVCVCVGGGGGCVWCLCVCMHMWARV